MRRIYTPDDILRFGKNRGLSLKEIYQYEPNYIEFLIINKVDFAIDIDLFESLPKPTPLSTGAVCGSEERKKIFRSGGSLIKKMMKTDNINMLTNVREIKKYAEESPESLPEVNFRFSAEARMKNRIKVYQFQHQ